MDQVEDAGVDPYVAVSRNESHSQRRYDYRPTSVTEKAPKTVKDPRLLVMQEKLQTEAGRKLYAKRKQTVEPVFGIIKSAMGFRQFVPRGLEEVGRGWGLVCLAYSVQRPGCSRQPDWSAGAPLRPPSRPETAQVVQALARTPERSRVRHGLKRSGIARVFCEPDSDGPKSCRLSSPHTPIRACREGGRMRLRTVPILSDAVAGGSGFILSVSPKGGILIRRSARWWNRALDSGGLWLRRWQLGNPGYRCTRRTS